jgi:hypothetical protein
MNSPTIDCRICRTANLPLLLACKCTQGHMHLHCLQKWIEVNGNTCEVCLTKYYLSTETKDPEPEATEYTTVNISDEQILKLYIFSIFLACSNAFVDQMRPAQGIRLYTCMLFTIAYIVIGAITLIHEIFDITLALLPAFTALVYVVTLLIIGEVDWISVLQLYILICFSLFILVIQIGIKR